ncbi:hypothetical protein SOVF_087800 [Spinacia oleracea]|nr:hypothetical protein SOVF_087800 [Spinacia oleracea]
MEPIGRRTRLQRALRSEKTKKDSKQARIAARRRFNAAKTAVIENGFRYVSATDDDGEDSDDDEEAAVVVDEEEFMRGYVAPNNNDVNANYNPFLIANIVAEEKGKGVMNDYYETGFESDESLQIIGERWNPLDVWDNASDDDNEVVDVADVVDFDVAVDDVVDFDVDIDDVVDFDVAVDGVNGGGGGGGDGGGCPLLRGGNEEDKPGTSGVKDFEMADLEFSEGSDCDFQVGIPELSESSEILSSDDDDDDDDDDEEEKDEGRCVSSYDEILKMVPEVKKRRRSPEKIDPTHLKTQKVVAPPPRKRLLVFDEEEDEEDLLGQVPKEEVVTEEEVVALGKKPQVVSDNAPPKKAEVVALGKKPQVVSDNAPPKRAEEGVVVFALPCRKQSRKKPTKRHNVLDTFESIFEREENVAFDTTRKEAAAKVVGTFPAKVVFNDHNKKKVKVKDVEDGLLNTILENGNAAVLDDIHTKEVEDLLRKFRFGVEEKPVPEKTIDEEDIEGLFKELDFGLDVCDIGLQTPCLYDNEEEDTILCDNAVSQAKLCRQGKHFLVENEEIGLICKFCKIVAVEIRDVTPAFNDNPFGKSVSSSNGRFPHDHKSNTSEGFQFLDSDNDTRSAHEEEDTRGTVWDLIPGTKRTLYEHQQKGFEFIWTNVAGSIKIDDLGKPSEFGLGGCIICHAPGTGKTRLALVFLQSYLKKYPMSKPVIIAPSSMLLTWEEQFARWNVDVPFVNLNSDELSSKETEVLKCVKSFKHSKSIRKAKLCIWAMGKGVLGLSYRMFEKLAGERKNTDVVIKKALLEQSGILVLDEGHTPRNEDSYIWKVFSDVRTKKRIILSGTPFQNNFVELNNTLSLIREEFGDPLLKGNQVQSVRKGKRRFYSDSSSRVVDEEKRIQELRNRLKPFVHVHKGEILRKTLRGLFHSVIVLKPSDLQKQYIQKLGVIRSTLLADYLVSITSVHPCLLYKCEQVPKFVNKELLQIYKTDLDVGVKIKFLFELIKLSKGEKVLVFSQFLIPLTFIGELLKSHFNWSEGNEYLLMEGKQRTKLRQSLIGQFNDPLSSARVLLASTKACCEGIHLVGASRVVLLDVVWNPSVERQAISRAYRLGQKKDVYVYHLITAGTLEREKYDRQVAKERVSEQVFISSEGEGLKTNTLSGISEDRILEEMIEHEKLKNMFEKIIYQPKAHKLIESFGPLTL